MVLPVLYLIAMSSSVGWPLADTQMFHRIQANHVVLNENGLYVLDTAARHVLHFDLQGAQKRGFGSRGNGPGEMNFPKAIRFLDNRFYVSDLNLVHVFSRDGIFEKRVKVPAGITQLTRISQGWAGWSAVNAFDAEAPQILYRFDEALKERTVIGQWDGLKGRSSAVVSDQYYNPVEDHRMLVVDKTGSVVFVKPANSGDIHVFYLDQSETSRIIKPPGVKIAFNEDWGNTQLAVMNQQSKVQYKPDFPDYFPLIESMALSARNRLVVRRWRGMPDGKSLPVLAYNLHGDPVAPTLVEEKYHRVLAMGQGSLYVNLVMEEDEHSLTKILEPDLAPFLEKNPYTGAFHFEYPQFNWGK